MVTTVTLTGIPLLFRTLKRPKGFWFPGVLGLQMTVYVLRVSEGGCTVFEDIGSLLPLYVSRCNTLVNKKGYSIQITLRALNTIKFVFKTYL